VRDISHFPASGFNLGRNSIDQHPLHDSLLFRNADSCCLFFAVKMTSPQVTMQLQKLWRLALAALLSIGIISCCIYLPADSWWNKGRSYMNIPIARTINSASRPLLVTDLWVYNVDKIGNLLGLSYLINSQANFLVLPPKRVEIPQNFNEIFLYVFPQK
jgi:hypothetical protein